MIPFEAANLESYALVLRIEILLRELLQASWTSTYGPAWRKRLPEPLLRKVKDSQAEEQKPQFNFVRLGPLYYLTFGELLTVLSLAPSKAAVDRIGGSCVVKQIENICAPRNAICHSRPVTECGRLAIKALYEQLITALTESEAQRLASSPDVGVDRIEFARQMQDAFQRAAAKLATYPPSIEVPEVFQAATQQYWWLDDSLAGFSRARVEECVHCIVSYNNIHSGVGCAWDRQQFCDSTKMLQVLRVGMAELEKVTK